MIRFKPKQTTVRGKEAEWNVATWKLWNEYVAPLSSKGEMCSSANYFTPRPFKNEYDLGTKTEGFVYVVVPGFKVCLWERHVENGKEVTDDAEPTNDTAQG